mmetsp:Transcript_11681/g.21388  ORF Transcript_11681/g.21388 Transcript_11681/m.21388 type:complete len:216 (+) Transcript_11681:769-1416(+)
MTLFLNRPVISHLSIVLVLHKRVGESVSDADALQVETLANAIRYRRHEVAAVRLSKDIKRVRLQFGMFVEEFVQEVEHVFSGLLLVDVFVARVPVRETGAGRLIDENQRRVTVPRIWVVGRGFVVFVDLAGTVLMELSDGAGASRSASHPEDHRVDRRVAAALKVPEKVVLVARPFDAQVAGSLVHRVTQPVEDLWLVGDVQRVAHIIGIGVVLN